VDKIRRCEPPAPAIPLSNRRGISSKNGLSGFGIDKLAVSWTLPRYGFARESVDWDRTSVTYHQGKPSGTRSEVFVDAGDGFRFYVSVQESVERGQAFAKVELNPSRFVDPDGYSLAGVKDTRRSLVAALSEVGDQLVAMPVDIGELRVKRLDTARDFEGVSRPGQLIRALAPHPRPWSRRNMVHASPTKNRAETLTVGSGAGECRLYDKHVETGGGAPEGVVRFEAENRPAWCKNYGGIGHFGDLSEESVMTLARNRWDWSAMGTEVASSPAELLARVSAAGLSPARQRAFLGYLVEQAAGMGGPAASDTLSWCRKLQRDLCISSDVFSASVGVTSRLDFDEGREVLRVA
jgi:hypothetical protein